IRGPLSRGMQRFEDWQLPLVLRTPVSESGVFEARGLPPRAYRVVASAPDLGSATVEVTAPDENVHLRLEPEAVLEVLVVGEEGKPAARWVTVGVEGRGVRQLASGPDGIARFDRLPAGTAYVVPYYLLTPSGGLLPPHPTVVLAAGETPCLEVR